MDGTLTKPFTLHGLSDVLSRHLSPDAVAPALVAAADPEPAPIDEASVPLLDADTIANLADMAQTSGGAFAQRVVTIFAEHAPTAILQLRSATADASGDAAARAAHSLKSMSLNVGGKALAMRLAAIEATARAESLCPSADTIDAVDDLLRRTTDALQARFVPQEPALSLRAAL